MDLTLFKVYRCVYIKSCPDEYVDSFFTAVHFLYLLQGRKEAFA